MCAGGKAVFAELPETAATLKNGNAAAGRLRKVTTELKAQNGRSITFKPLAEALAAFGIKPDVTQRDGRNRVWWNHRADADGDWYFVTADNAGGFDGYVSFRQTGAVEIFDPATGKTRGAGTVKRSSERTELKLTIEPSQGYFVMFRRNGNAVKAVSAVSRDGKAVENASCWRVLNAGYGAMDANGKWVEGKWMDLTARLQQALDRRETGFHVSNEKLGRDPAWRSVKSFKAELLGANGERLPLTGGENSYIKLPYQLVQMPECTVAGETVCAWRNGAWQVVYGDGEKKSRQVKNARELTFADGWKVRFAEGWGMPTEMTGNALAPWKTLGTTPEAKAYSGTAVYVKRFTLTGDIGRAMLSLGRVESLARVRLNGVDLGALWCEPYRVEVTQALKAGENTLEIEVTDTWFNRLVFDAGQSVEKRRTWTIAGPSAKAQLVDSGLLGPVKLYLGEEI